MSFSIERSISSDEYHFVVCNHPLVQKKWNLSNSRSILCEVHLPGLIYLEKLSVILCTRERLSDLDSLNGLTLHELDPGISIAPRNIVKMVDPSLSLEYPAIPHRLSRPVSICVVDSGISARTPLHISEAISFARGLPDCDETGHGTKVVHTLSDPYPASRFCGMAVGARILVAKVDDHWGALRPEARLLRAINWAICRNAEIVNISIGYVRRAIDPFRATTHILAAYLRSNPRPIFVASAGYQYDGISDPASAEGVIAVAGAFRDSHDPSSPRGAPLGGVAISANSGGFYCNGFDNKHGCHSRVVRTMFDGTSAACAFITGVVARIIDYEPFLAVPEIREKLCRMANAPVGWEFGVGGCGVIYP